MDLQIKKDHRTTGQNFQKSPKGIECTKTKEWALNDISEECIDNKHYHRNYARVEATVLNACKCLMKIYRIDTTIL